MLPWISKIPEDYKKEFELRRAACMRSCLRVLCVSVASLFSAAVALSLYVNREDSVGKRLALAAYIVATCGLVFRSAPRTTRLTSLRLMGLFVTCVILFAIVEGPPNDPGSYAYAGVMISMIAIVLLMPWTFGDSVFIIALHFFAWMMYYISRDFSLIHLPATIFGTHPLVNGLAFISITAILCLIIRHNDNRLDETNFLLFKDVESRKGQMERELELAARVHNTLQPRSFTSEKMDVFVSYRPASLIGGDYAQFHQSDGRRLTFLIGDVTGHGVPAALMVNRLHVEFETLAREHGGPGMILKKMNDFILSDFKEVNMYLTAFCGTVLYDEKKILYSNHGHPPQLLYRVRQRQIVDLSPHATWLGIHDGQERMHETEIPYEEGDLLFLFTDGVLETRDAAGEIYGKQRLKEFLIRSLDLDLSALHRELMRELSDYSRNAFKDDVFMVSLKPRISAGEALPVSRGA
ncbi:MAG TPA: PP2C family protein-serine/threonine phosphatase [Verrucomicrobiae bacterium]|jgi:serine phosphatase RsbU (regulator of sigma subunit)|nr:PP2C family protein-serine/threonine phosphatase [Verrucomicrobiae bacterium]